jgi:hypothetical protein
MMKVFLFIVLYLKGLRLLLGMKISNTKAPKGLRGSCMLMFYDHHEDKPHGVVALVIPKGKATKHYQPNLWGPAGWSDRTRLYRIGVKKWSVLGTRFWLPILTIVPTEYRLYARDTWGTVTREQILRHPKLKALHEANPGRTILLAGVRKLWKWHIWPFNKATSFILVEYQ